MIDVLSPSFMQYDVPFSFKSLSNNVLRKESLKQKLANLRTRMEICEQQINVIKEEQAVMEHTAVVIQHNQEEITCKQEKLKERQLGVIHDIQQVKQNHANIQQTEAFISLTFKALVYCALDIYKNQVNVKKESMKIEDKRQKIHHDAVKIHQNIPVIIQNFQQAWDRVRVIEDKVIHIQESHEVIEETVTKIEEKRDYIRNNIPLLISIPGQYGNRFEQRQALGAKKIAQEEAIGWFKRIQDFCLWIIARICERFFLSYQAIKPWLVKG